jgi:hypothetical protein
MGPMLFNTYITEQDALEAIALCHLSDKQCDHATLKVCPARTPSNQVSSDNLPSVGVEGAHRHKAFQVHPLG